MYFIMNSDEFILLFLLSKFKGKTKIWRKNYLIEFEFKAKFDV